MKTWVDFSLSRQEARALFLQGPHFLLLVGSQVRPEGRSGRPRAPRTRAQQRVLAVLQVSAEPLHACALQVVPTVTRSTALFKLELGDLSRRFRRCPGAQILVQGKVIFALIGNPPEPPEEAPVGPHVAAVHPLELRP